MGSMDPLPRMNWSLELLHEGRDAFHGVHRRRNPFSPNLDEVELVPTFRARFMGSSHPLWRMNWALEPFEEEGRRRGGARSTIHPSTIYSHPVHGEFSQGPQSVP